MKTQAVHSGTYVETLGVNPVYQGYQILHWGFTVAPIIAGADKFFNALANWSQYLWPPLANLFGGAQNFMMIVGAVEIVAGFLVAFKPKIGAHVVAAWLAGIVVNLLLAQNFYDIALRDFGLSLGALALGRLALEFDHPHVPNRDDASTGPLVQ